MASELIKQRAIVKGKLTRFSNFLNTFNVETGNIRDLNERYTRIQNLLDEFDKIQTKLDMLSETDEINSIEREEFENLFFTSTGVANSIIELNLATVEPSQMYSAKPRNHISKLPELKLPLFDGKYHEWSNFHDSFQSLVNSNSALSNIEKFQYLKTSLRGDAARVIQCISISEENYETAWLKVVERYEDKESIIIKHVQDLFQLPTINKESSVSLRQFADDISNHLAGINNLDKSDNLKDRLLIHLLSGKLDHMTKREWETEIATKPAPALDMFLKFIVYRAKLLEKVNIEKPRSTRFNQNNFGNKNIKHCTSSYVAVQKEICTFCKNSHKLNSCQAFIQLSASSRINEAKKLNLCLNCLKRGHSARDCFTASRCKTCQKKHHTLLHIDNTSNQINNPEVQSQNNESSTLVYSANAIPSTTLLATASVTIVDHLGMPQQCRAILDSGSQANFISESLCNKLNVPRVKTIIPVVGINQSAKNVYHNTTITFISNVCKFQTSATFLILPKLTEYLPSSPVDITNFKVPKGVQLADPNFHIPGKIDLLIGSSIFWDLLLEGQIKFNAVNLMIHNTKLGWVVSGHYNSSIKNVACNISINEKILNQLIKFWEVEKCDTFTSTLSREERVCEDHYEQTTRRNDDGRFIVNIPFKSNLSHLGSSYQTALRRFGNLENKLNRSPELKRQYNNFMKEYEELGHMTEMTNDNLEIGYYLPHHAVQKESSSTTKLRVVFDGSCKTSSGLSLNDVQMTGPSLQTDLINILLRFRKHTYVLKADIAKMYRQILVDETQRKYQKIVWRPNKNKEIKTYKLNTLVYGTGSAPFLAIRTLKQVAQECQTGNPVVSNIILNDMYVDDLLTGGETIETVILIKHEISQILATAGFELRKWQSNNRSIVGCDGYDSVTPISLIDKDAGSKTLGVYWDSNLDILRYEINLNSQKRITKRGVLSVIAQIFDPLGLLGPVIITAKIILQKLWKSSVTWDESIPSDLENEWHRFTEGLTKLNQISIPRKINSGQYKFIELHGFCDASEKAYGACVYVRSESQYDSITAVSLVCAKSRVAPLKQLSLPRLELLGALLLARLINKVKIALSLKFDREICWTDSTITLAWISGSPARWKQFVAHRVSEIQELTNECEWRHVSTSVNPADLISRGVHPVQLKDICLWWNGPDFLQEPESLWPQFHVPLDMNAPERKLICSYHVREQLESFELINRYSNYNKLLRVTANLLRFIDNCKDQNQKSSGLLTVLELNKAENALVRIAQRDEFHCDIHRLINNKPIGKKSKLLSLAPYLDNNKILRVGGRLKNSNFNVDQRHPIILPSKHPLTILLIRHEHERLMHAGTATTLASLRTKYWPIAGRNSIKRVLRQCIPCLRNTPKMCSTLMGDLPSYRTTPCRPFLKTGVDYAGPFTVKEGYYKRSRSIKVYIAVFVCMVTKAIHIEVVHSLTTEAFLSALHRFIARRGMVSDIYSDNGNNFVGANNELRNLKSLFDSELNGNKIIKTLANDNITWHFIPPRAPHFGGLWEAAIKSAKNHMNRVIGKADLKFDTFVTTLTQIEAILNSRPLTPISTDPNDLSCLTPGHFLIGDTLVTPLHPDLRQISDNRLSQWQHSQKLQQHFWARWSKEYISLLQQRYKWRTNSDILKIGQVVLIKDDNLPPLRWLIGRIIDLHPGPDGIVRVVSIKTAQSVFKRSISRVCVLPVE